MPRRLNTERLDLHLLGPEHLAQALEPLAMARRGAGDDQRQTFEWLERRQDRYAELGLAWYGLWTADGTLVGSCGAFVGERCGGDPEIGYEVGDPHRGFGYATEATAAATAAVHDAGHPQVWATIRASNVTSQRIVRRLGFVHTSTRPDDDALFWFRHKTGC